jgi:glutamine amidotransferase
LIAVIDYGMGNLHSVTKALERLGYEAQVVTEPQQLVDATAVILPGVGAFGDAMQNLRQQNFVPAIYEYVKTGKPFLGICLGMQLLFDSSEEMGSHQGLGLIHGSVVRFQGDYKVPQMGWNELQLHNDQHFLFAGLNELTNKSYYVYFVHSYHALADNHQHVLATTDYYGQVTAIVAKDNVMGMQFHPEKSSEIGLKLLENFAREARK